MKVDFERALSFVGHLVEIGLLEAIRETPGFYPYGWLKENDNLFNTYYFADGACKGVFCFQGIDWVIKFDYCNGNSYCGRELENYIAAKEAGLAHYFPETIALCNYDNIYFILQERCDCSEDEVQDVMFDSLKRRYEEWGDSVSNDDIWDEVYDIETHIALTCIFDDPELDDFVDERHINDLHTANFGKIDDHYVILDFSGYGYSVWEK